MSLLAGVDLGSNNFRLLVAEKTADGVLRQVALENRIVRAGQGIGAGGAVVPEALARVHDCLSHFKAVIDGCGGARVFAALTAAGRDLRGGGAYAELARELLGAEVFVPTGVEEATLAFAGAMGVLGLAAGDRAMLDIGGGSTEVAFSLSDSEPLLKSLKIGVVRLTEELKPAHPAGAEGFERLKRRTRDEFSALADAPAFRALDKGRISSATLVVTAGTALTLAALVSGKAIGDTRSLTGVAITRSEVLGAARSLSLLDLAQTRALPAIAEGREDVILSGVAILSAFMEVFGFDSCVVSDGGMAEGLVLHLAGDGCTLFEAGGKESVSSISRTC